MARSAWGDAARELERAAAELHPNVLPRDRMGMTTSEVVLGAMAMRAAPASDRARSFSGAFLMDTYRGLAAGLLKRAAKRLRRAGPGMTEAGIARELARIDELRSVLAMIEDPSNQDDPGVTALRAALAEEGARSRQ